MFCSQFQFTTLIHFDNKVTCKSKQQHHDVSSSMESSNSCRIWFIHKTFKKHITEIKTNARLWALTMQSVFYVFYCAFHSNGFNWQNIKQIDLRFRCPYQSEVCMHEMYNQANCMYSKKLSTKVYVLYMYEWRWYAF